MRRSAFLAVDALLLLLVGVVVWVVMRAPPGPAQPSEVAWHADRLIAGGPARITIEVTAGSEGLARGSELRVGFPHWVYGSAGVKRPPGAEQGAYGHWYVVSTLEEAVGAGAVHSVTLPTLRLPAASGSFRPLVFIDWELLPTDGQMLERGPPTRMDIVAPSALRGGEPFQLRTRLLDAAGNVLSVEVKDWEPMIGEGIVPFSITSDRPEGRFSAISHPVLFADDAPRVAWLDLHGHSGLSDGRGEPAEYFARARDGALLDGAALSDHDWQLDGAEWEELLTETEAANAPGRFVTLPAVEMNVNGHEVAYFLDPERLAQVSRGADGGAMTIWEETDRGLPGATPPDLLGDYGAAELIVATHSSLAGGMGTGYPLDEALPAYELFEIYSAHGSSECADCPRRVGGGPLEEEERVGSLWDALDAGHRFTLIAAGDSHDGRPGDTAWGGFPGGLTAVEVDELTRESVAKALREGRSWATTGERTLLQTRWSETGVRVRFVSQAPAEALEVVGDRRVIARIEAPSPGEWLEIEHPPTSWRYVRLILPEGARAWAGAR